ncbi:DUF4368 domain-containing protein [Eubacterium sp. BL-380-WT-2B]|uniref:DUF4368 domain-containing protein n=1 Tax=Ructibacterium gallinarum TaxID=2779355 RepID=A0A9D5RCB3_9FIRM|nr:MULTISPECIES: recombinase family protein [Eubacteriales]MBE5040843.1 DUF4368 domain-containing protein [Ructibacterium gallinarum]MSS95033.1 DUF4368 domain-containing protein [Eubacterium sp. BL-380-WT-2B]
MRQSSNKKREVTASLYLRLSRDDNLDGESYSIGNQKKLLTAVAKEKGYTNLLIYIDDGISGVTMNRPDYIRMIEDFENNKSSALFVKDLSRIGRNYIEVGKLTEEFLPEHDIRLVAVSDNIDTQEGENELAPIKNLFNEWYARDISKKRRISNKIKGNAGEPMGMPPYGYMKNPDGSKSWVVDEEAANVVRRIFDMTLEGVGTHQIADILASENVLIPTSYWISKGIGRPGSKTALSCEWKSSTIVSILSKQEYCGDVLNFKTYSKSYKNKKRYANDRENWVIFKDVHEPIIDRAVWETIQERRSRKTRKKQKADGEKNMFSGLLVCADCGSNLWYHFNQANHDIQYFNCSGYNKGNRKICNSTHYIRVDFLEKVVLGEIRRLTKLATQYESEFAKIVMGHSIKAAEQERQLKQKELNSLTARDKELDNLFEHLYEDNVCGKISDDRFAKMSVKYESEQKEVSSRIKELQTELESEKSKAVTSDMFMASVRKYTRARKLTPRMLNELIEKIEVHQSEKIDGKTVQRLTIHYNCIGAIEIPDLDKLPENNVSVHTRQGVDVHYAACAS